MNKKGLKETMYEAITAGEKDYSALVSKLKSKGIEAVYLGGYHTEGGLIVGRMSAQGVSTELMRDDGLVKVSDKSIELTEIGKDFSQNVSNIFDSYDPPNKSYEKRLEDIRKAKDKQAELLDNI